MNDDDARADATNAQRMHLYLQLAAVLVVVVVCYLVLHSSVPAALFAAVICSASWPLYLRIRKFLGGRAGLAALAMTLLMILLVIGPSVLLVMTLTDNVADMIASGKAAIAHGPVPPPAWLRKIPIAGDLMAEYWQRMASSRVALSESVLVPARNFAIGAGKSLGADLLQLALSVFIGFFLYRDGESMIVFIRQALDKLAGKRGQQLMDTVGESANAVVYGTFGTGLAQGLVALVGFLIAGVPTPFLLAIATAFLSILPIGPPIVWGGAALWLLYQDQLGWAVFMALWGFLAISSIDNLVKPYLISRSSNLPLLLTVLGVVGGVVAFGFIGLFIGPPVLAVGWTLVQMWVRLEPGSIVGSLLAPQGDQGNEYRRNK